MDQLLYTVTDAAPLLGVKETRLRELVDAGRIPYVQLGDGGLMFISRSDLEAFVDGLPRRRKGEPEKITNAVPNQGQPHRNPSARNGREPITPIRLSATQEGSP